MRLAAQVAAVLGQIAAAAAAVFALLTYERVIAWAVFVSIGLGIVNFVRLGRQAKALRDLQEAQGRRIDRLPPPPGG